ncbi:MAG: DUF4156 domain-containing protein [Arenicella sp.]
MKNVMTVLILLILTGCAATKLKPEATLVRLTHVEPSTEKCQFLGDITGSQGDPLQGLFTENKDLETGARHDLKNQAHAMGGNVVYLLTQRSGESGIFTGSTEQVDVTLSGNVYRCSNNTL